MAHNIWLSASHIAGSSKKEADFLSRPPTDNHDYSLSQAAFDKLVHYLDIRPQVDLFVSRVTHKLKPYVTANYDPLAMHADAFTLTWRGCIYVFPPICLIGKVVDKLIADEVEVALLITPFWPGLPCIPVLFQLLITDPIYIPVGCLEGVTPTHHQFHLVAYPISRLPAKKRAFQKLLQKRCLSVLEKIHSVHMNDVGLSLPAG